MKPSTMVVVDIQQLESINDTHGHQLGDATIRAVSPFVTPGKPRLFFGVGEHRRGLTARRPLVENPQRSCIGVSRLPSSIVRRVWKNHHTGAQLAGDVDVSSSAKRRTAPAP